MKKVLLSLGVVAAMAMTSCGGGDMCACATDMKAIGEKLEGASEEEQEEIMKELEAKSKECEEIAKSLEEGKSEEELEAMHKDLVENCEALKGAPH
jgi:predicted nuclease with TOPRIM domain